MVSKKTKHSPRNKNVWVILAIVVVVVIGIKIAYVSNSTPKSFAPTTTTVSTQPLLFDFGNQILVVNNQKLSFVNGSYTDKTYGQHTASISDKTDNPSKTKSAAILTDNPGGSGTFFYVVGVSVNDGKAIYSKPVLLGDRIKIVSMSVDEAGAQANGIVTVKYLDRSIGAPMATEPTEEKTVQYAFEDNGNLMTILH